METLSYRIIMRLTKILNVILITVPFVICWKNGYSCSINTIGGEIVDLSIVALFVLLYITYSRIYGSFLVSLVRISEMIYSQCLTIIMSDGVMYVIFCLLTMKFVSTIPFFLTLAIQLVLAATWCIGTHIWYFRTFPAKKTAIIYDRNQSIEELINTYGLRKKFDVQRSVSVEECIVNRFTQLDGIEAVFLWGVHSHERNAVLKYCIQQNIIVYVAPRIGDVIMSGARQMHLFHLPFLRVGRYDPAPEYLLMKRLLDIVFSSLALIVLSPIMLLIAVAIKLTDGGPIFYRQKRLTKNRKEFYVLKFRSMRQDAEMDGVARLSTGNQDDRITSVGRIIRKVRMDEIPQLLNVLSGSMSLVGPRPERPEIALQYEQDLPEFSLRLQAKAGLTGYAQIYGKYNTSPYDKLQMDLMYISHPSILEDLRIIFATIKILFISESTDGIEEGMETAFSKHKEEEKEKVEV